MNELSTTQKYMILDRCQHNLNLMKDRMLPNLLFTDEKKFDVQHALTTKIIEFGVEMDQCKAGE